MVKQEMPCLEGPTWWSSGQPLITACNSAPGTRITIATCRETVLLRTEGAGGITGDAEGFLNFMNSFFVQCKSYFTCCLLTGVMLPILMGDFTEVESTKPSMIMVWSGAPGEDCGTLLDAQP